MKTTTARILAWRLRAEKSDHPWTATECSLLAELCAALNVDDDDFLSKSQRDLLAILIANDGWIIGSDPHPFVDDVPAQQRSEPIVMLVALEARGFARTDDGVATATAEGKAWLWEHTSPVLP